ncbi:MAG: glutathione S-transferase N-terminal domain-containing protein [Ruminococcus sp.]|nr:glutathione S-transferase N-terminal domain-containing protein [Ruminococcus sp.]
MIQLYTSDSCVWCRKMKQYLKSKNVDFEELNVSDAKNAERVYSLSGQRAIPVTVIGNRVIVGFDTNAVDHALAEE